MALTNVQNEFLKMQMANNPEFMAQYFPNIITQRPSGPLYNIDYQSDRPANVHHIFDPDFLDSNKAAEFREINVPYDTLGSRLNIKDIIPRHDMFPGFPRKKGMDYAHVKPSELYHEGRPVHGGQTQAIYVNPDILASYGTTPSSPRNEMVNSPEWWTQAGKDFGIETGPTVDQATLNEFITTMLSHEVGHGVSDLPPYQGITAGGETLDFSKFLPPISNLKNTDYSVGYQGEMVNRMRDIEKLKMLYPNDYEEHPLWQLYQNRAKMKFAELTGQKGWLAASNPAKFKNYQKKIKPHVDKYFEKVKAPEKVKAFEAAGAYSPQVQQDPGGGGTWRQQTAAKEAAGQQVAGPGFGKGAYFAHGGLANLLGE